MMGLAQLLQQGFGQLLILWIGGTTVDHADGLLNHRSPIIPGRLLHSFRQTLGLDLKESTVEQAQGLRSLGRQEAGFATGIGLRKIEDGEFGRDERPFDVDVDTPPRLFTVRGTSPALPRPRLPRLYFIGNLGINA